jgi:hypothetical protein
MPELQFRHYDDKQIAENVLWPLVDHFWHDDWRAESAVGQSMHVEKRGVWKGEAVDISLAAYKQFADTDEHEELGMNTLSVVHFDIETIVEDERRTLIRDLMQADVYAVVEELDDFDEDDEIEAIEDEDLDDYYFKLHTGYTLDTESYVSADSYRVIEDMDGDLLWHDDGDHEEKEPPTDDEMRRVMIGALPKAKLFRHDMEMLECGLYVLNAPEAIHRAFLKIRKNPLRTGE